MSTSTSVLFIDSKVRDYQTLLAGLGSNVEVYILNAKQGGVLQMAQVLQGRSGLDSIQIISHGSSGALSLGSGVLSGDNLGSYADALGQMDSALSDTGDILLYGCDVAQGDDGLSFVNQLAALTGADVAASDDLTGNAALGGDWDLEAQTGDIEITSAFSTKTDYKGLLISLTDIMNSIITFDKVEKYKNGDYSDFNCINSEIDKYGGIWNCLVPLVDTLSYSFSTTNTLSANLESNAI
jgi:hypothetical protein